MAIIEVQFEKGSFLEILKANFSRQEIPRGLFADLAPDRILEKIEIVDAVDITDEQERVGKLTLKINFLQHHTTFTDAENAGSLKPPATQQLPCEITFDLSLTGDGNTPPDPRLQVWTKSLKLGSNNQPVLAASIVSFGNVGFDIANFMLVSSADIVAFRFSTKQEDFLEGPVSNKLEGLNWGFFAEGNLFADQLSDTINSVVEASVAGSSDPVLEFTERASPNWVANPPHAFSKVEINAVDAIPLGFDVSVEVTARTHFNVPQPPNGLEAITTISWEAQGFFSNFGVVKDKVNDAIKEELAAPGELKEIERGEDFVKYSAFSLLFVPRSDLFTATITQASVAGDGLHVLGTISVAGLPSVSFYLADARWVNRLDCKTKNLHTRFSGPVLHVNAEVRSFQIKIDPAILVKPPGTWNPRVESTNKGIGVHTVEVIFELPVGATPVAGLESSAFITGNMGVRWVDLGKIPKIPETSFVTKKAFAISQCMAISDRWGMGIFNLDWLVDPPFDSYGFPPLREWTVIAAGLPNEGRIQFNAVGPAGTRNLGFANLQDGALFAQVVTDADETLQVEGHVRSGTDTPQVYQRWISPIAELPLTDASTPLAVMDDTIWLKNSREMSSVSISDLLENNTSQRRRDPADRHIEDRRSDAAEEIAQAVVSDGKFLALRHRGKLLIAQPGKATSYNGTVRF